MATEGITDDDYLDGLEKLTEIRNVKYISKISGKRVIIYLKNKELVQQLKNKVMKVKEFSLQIKPYGNNNKRVVISYVQPFIPDIILKSLQNKGVRIV